MTKSGDKKSRSGSKVGSKSGSKTSKRSGSKSGSKSRSKSGSKKMKKSQGSKPKTSKRSGSKVGSKAGSKMGSKDGEKAKRRVKVYVKRSGSKAGSKDGQAVVVLAAVKNVRGKYDITGISFLRKFKKHRELAMPAEGRPYMNSWSYVNKAGVVVPAPVIPAEEDEVFLTLRRGAPLDDKTREVVDGLKQAMVTMTTAARK
jgi:hypothetical protein